jgi:hypothetical protein
MAKFNCSTDQSLVTDRRGHLKKNWLRTLLREIELGHTLTLNVWENLELGENQWKIIKTLYYIEVLGCLSPLLTIFQLYHSTWSSVLLVEENGKNHRAGFELTTLVVMGTDCTCSWKSNYHTIKMAIFIIILKACNRQYSDYSWSLCILFIFYFVILCLCTMNIIISK